MAAEQRSRKPQFEESCLSAVLLTGFILLERLGILEDEDADTEAKLNTSVMSRESGKTYLQTQSVLIMLLSPLCTC